MKKLIFRNPFKEALYIQGKRWLVTFWVTIAMLFMLSIGAFCLGMNLCGNVTAVAALLGPGFFTCWFGFETVEAEEE